MGEATANLLAKASVGATQVYGNIFHPQEAWINKTFGPSLGEAESILQKPYTSPVEGAPATVAEKLGGMPRPQVAAGQAAIMREQAPDIWQRLEIARKTAMGRKISSIAQTQEAVQSAAEDLDAANKVNYGAVNTKTVASDPKLERLLARASEAVAKAEKAANIQGREFSSVIDSRTPVQKAYGATGEISAVETKAGAGKVSPTVTDVTFERDPITGQLKTTSGYNPVTGERVGAPAGVKTTATETRATGGGVKPATGAVQYSGKTLAEIDRAIGELANQPAATGMTETISKSLLDLQGELRKHLYEEGRLPELKKAVETHASESRGIERMKLGQFVQGLVADIENPAGERRFLKYWEEVRKGNARPLIQDATGNNTAQSLKITDKGPNLGLTSGEYNKLESIAKKIEERRTYERMARGGAAADVRVGEKTPFIHTLSKEGMIANMMLRLKGEALSKAAANKLAGILSAEGNEAMLQAFEQARRRGEMPKKNADAVMNALKKAGGAFEPAKKAYTTVEAQAVRNFLSPDQNNNSLNY